MTSVVINDSSLKAVGHAGYATSGNDIVCASVSILCYQLAQWLTFNEEKQERLPEIKLESGNVDIKCYPKTEYAEEFKHIFDYILVGFELLENQFPQNIKIL